MSATYVIGIDLGTTNSVLAYAPLEADEPHVRTAAGPAAGRPVDGRGADHAAVLPVSGRPHERAGRSICPGRRGAISPSASWPAARRPRCPTGPWPRPSRGSATATSTATSRSCPGTPRRTCRRSRRSTASQRYPGAPGRRLGGGLPRGADGRAGGGADRARLVRRQRPRTDPRGGAGRRACRTVSCCWKSRRRPSTPGWPTPATAGGGCWRSATRCWSATSAAARPT